MMLYYSNHFFCVCECDDMMCLWFSGTFNFVFVSEKRRKKKKNNLLCIIDKIFFSMQTLWKTCQKRMGKLKGHESLNMHSALVSRNGVFLELGFLLILCIKEKRSFVADSYCSLYSHYLLEGSFLFALVFEMKKYLWWKNKVCSDWHVCQSTIWHWLSYSMSGYAIIYWSVCFMEQYLMWSFISLPVQFYSCFSSCMVNNLSVNAFGMISIY